MYSLKSLARARRSITLLGLALGLLPALFVAEYTAADENARLGLHRISTYRVISDKLIIIEANSKKNYRVELFPGCFGLRHAHTLAFQTRGGNTLDRFSSVVLRDGTRCRFKSFAFVPELPEASLQGDIQSPETNDTNGAPAD